MKRLVVLIALAASLVAGVPSPEQGKEDSRWYFVGRSKLDEPVYIDLATFKYSSDKARAMFWFKVKGSASETMTRLDMTGSHYYRHLADYTYDSVGRIVDSHHIAEAKWVEIVPGSVGELLYETIFEDEDNNPPPPSARDVPKARGRDL